MGAGFSLPRSTKPAVASWHTSKCAAGGVSSHWSYHAFICGLHFEKPERPPPQNYISTTQNSIHMFLIGDPSPSKEKSGSFAHLAKPLKRSSMLAITVMTVRQVVIMATGGRRPVDPSPSTRSLGAPFSSLLKNATPRRSAATQHKLICTPTKAEE